MLLRRAGPADIPRIVALERSPTARQFVGQWSEERHLATLTGNDARYFVSENRPDHDAPGALQAYVILRGFSEDCGAIDLKRIVVAAPGRGLGREIVSEVIRMAFEEFHAHRLFLDVYEDNARARHLYDSLGFVFEGTMRDAARRGENYCDLRVMSILATEYKRSGRPEITK